MVVEHWLEFDIRSCNFGNRKTYAVQINLYSPNKVTHNFEWFNPMCVYVNYVKNCNLFKI